MHGHSWPLWRWEWTELPPRKRIPATRRQEPEQTVSNEKMKMNNGWSNKERQLQATNLVVAFEQRAFFKVLNRQHTSKKQFAHDDGETTQADLITLLFPVEHF